MGKMTPTERRAVGSLSAIMSLRLVGLFMVLPVFALYAHDLALATPFLIGLAMGIYGLTQGLLQIPFGILSDLIGRKPVIAAGLLIFMTGSIIAASSHSIYTMIIGRALQGAGAVGSTIIATLADLTTTEQRSKAMAINGMTIGVSFALAMILGPLLVASLHVSGIFWLAALFCSIGLVLLFTAVPLSPTLKWHADSEPTRGQFFQLLKQPLLARLNWGVFLLHAIFTASFVVIPIALQNSAGLVASKQWQVYLPALLAGFILSLVMIMVSEKKQQVKKYFSLGVVILGLSEIILLLGEHNVWGSLLGLFGFFTAFSLLEAFLPSYVSRAAPAARKGTALGIYSSAQFLGIFAGGSAGGWLYGVFGVAHVYLFCGVLALIWLAITCGMQDPQHSSFQSTNSHSVGQLSDPENC